jgi:predicted PurR-regulated permease PerM
MAQVEVSQRRTPQSVRERERWFRVRPRTVLQILGLIITVWAVLHVLSVARQIIVWALVALFLALAINPLVEWLHRRFFPRRGLAVAVAVLLVLVVIGAVGALFVPTLIDQTNKLVDAAPGYIDDLTKGRGRLGFLETKYHIVQKTREFIDDGGASKIFGFTGTALAVTKGILNIVIASVTISVLTIFMLLEGPAWTERLYGLLRPESQRRWRSVGHDIYRTVGGYVTGNLLISLIAGVSATVVLLALGVPFAVALGLLVAILDLIPLAGATVAAIIVCAVGFLDSVVAGCVLVAWFVLYQQLENHLLQPMIYGRTVKISPLVVLLSVLIGAKLAGVLGALGAIPVAGTIQILIVDALAERRPREIEDADSVETRALEYPAA